MAGRRTDQPTTAREVWGPATGKRVWVGGHSTVAKREIEPLLDGASRPAEGPLDAGFVTPQSVDEAVYFASKLRSRVSPAGVIWIIHPTPQSVHRAAFSGNPEDLAVELFSRGFTEVGHATITNDFASVGFRATAGFDRANAEVPGQLP